MFFSILKKDFLCIQSFIVIFFSVLFFLSKMVVKILYGDFSIDLSEHILYIAATILAIFLLIIRILIIKKEYSKSKILTAPVIKVENLLLTIKIQNKDRLIQLNNKHFNIEKIIKAGTIDVLLYKKLILPLYQK